MSIEATIAVNRFGLGALPGEIASAGNEPKQWLISQLGPADQPFSVSGEPFKTGATLVTDLQAFRQMVRSLKKEGDQQRLRDFRVSQRQVLINEMSSRFLQ